MPDLRRYWDEIRQLESSLPEYVWLTSLENPAKGQIGGRVSQVASSVAARLLQAKSHRMATEDETTDHQTEQENLKREAFRQRLQRQGIAWVPVADDKR